MPEEELIELKFRLNDGSDIGPIRYSSASTVAALKERIVAEWPRGNKVSPKASGDIKLISGGKILENSKTVGQCRVPFGDLPGGIITMHVIVQPSLAKIKTGMIPVMVVRMERQGQTCMNPFVPYLYTMKFAYLIEPGMASAIARE